MTTECAVFAYTGGSKGDLIEQAMKCWVERSAIKFRRRKSAWNIKVIPDVKAASLRSVLRGCKDAKVVGLWGHGRDRDGALLDTQNKPVVHSRNKSILSGKSIFAMFCHSDKLLGGLKGSRAPYTTLSFKDKIWLIIHPGGESFAGFERAAMKALSELLISKNGTLAADEFRQESSKWALYWLSRLWQDLTIGKAVGARDAFLCVSAFVNNAECVS